RFMPLTYLTMTAALEEGLWPSCTDIVRLQHGNRSSAKAYKSSFIPGLHDVCLVLERLAADERSNQREPVPAPPRRGTGKGRQAPTPDGHTAARETNLNYSH